MSDYKAGVEAERARVIALLDQYEITQLQGGAILLSKPVVIPDKSWKGVTHKTGSVATYVKRGCRCVNCKAAMSAYQRERRTARLIIKGEQK